ncbi:glycoside hydrolase family 16 protein [Xylariomycetidae sp. FL0641]|nr:glycoside hydrolase family 16 protein [Xylariomycetidae sp. FL0641]
MAYSLSTHFAGQGLLDSFSFFTGNDPNGGFVDYQSKDDALAKKLVSIDEFNRVKLGVDSSNAYTTSDKGRPSVRLTSNNDFNHGLFIADFEHMPGSACGTWPAFWAFNDQPDDGVWPAGGEVDIIEGGNTAQRNLYSAHTSANCRAPSSGFNGVQSLTDCSPTPDNKGCNYAAPVSDTSSYGDVFNAEGGGVYAMEWTSEALKLWHFPRSTIPADITYAPVVTPNPANWGPPQAIFGGSACDADSHFFNMSLVINTNFCGDYAGNIWGVADQCNKLAPTCKEYVAANPSSFKNAFWNINYIDVYTRPAASNMTIPPILKNMTSSRAPSMSTSTLAPSSNVTLPSSKVTMSASIGTVVPSGTRTVTVSTVTHVITTAEPTRTGGGLVDPAKIGDYTLLGCFGSSAGYQSFSQVAQIATMDNEACVASCAGRKYAGVSGDTCYCADILGDAGAVANEMCDLACPGNPREFCGGVLEAGEIAAVGQIGGAGVMPSSNMTAAVNGTLTRRAHAAIPRRLRRSAPANILLTVYGDLGSDGAPPGAPAMGGDAPSAPEPPKNVTRTEVVTLTYTTVCATNPAKLTTVEYCTTVTYEECPTSPAASMPAAPTTSMSSVRPALAAVPMTTCTETCRACGPRGQSTVTLTVPAAVATSEVVVSVLAVQTVVPVPKFSVVPVAAPAAALKNATIALANGTMLAQAAVSPNAIPVVAGAGSGVGALLGWGLGLWFGLFGVLMAL